MGAGRKPLTNEEFIKKAKQIHGDKFNYSKVNYIHNKKQIVMICNKCGYEWLQWPTACLYHKVGCPKCANKATKELNDFIKEANITHNNKYNYSKTIYKNSRTKVEIVCPKHGTFWQSPSSHIQGNGCPKCGYDIVASKMSSNTEDFISKAKEIHGDMYEYSETDYKNNRIKVKIKCNTCGEVFIQQPNDHLNGCGCPYCKQSKGELAIKKYLHSHNIKYYFQYRILECRDKWPLPFDFYLPDYNICVEYDGKQHFQPVSRFGSLEGLNYIKHHDQIKTLYCKENNIKLIRIPYTEINNITDILDMELK